MILVRVVSVITFARLPIQDARIYSRALRASITVVPVVCLGDWKYGTIVRRCMIFASNNVVVLTGLFLGSGIPLGMSSLQG